jgi:cell division protein FtsB
MSKPSDADLLKGTLGNLKSLEAAVRRAQDSIRKLSRENAALKKRLEDLHAERKELGARTKQLQENAKTSMMSRGRSNLAKAKIQEIIRRIEQLETEGELARNED